MLRAAGSTRKQKINLAHTSDMRMAWGGGVWGRHSLPHDAKGIGYGRIYSDLLNDAVGKSDYIAWNERMINERWSGMDMEGSGRDLI
jgi:hypothetical protein